VTRALLVVSSLVVLCTAACGKAAAPAPAAPDAAPRAAAAPATDARPPAAAAYVPGPRPGGPSQEACTKAAAHLGDLIEDSALGPTAEQRAYLERVLAHDHDQVVAYCLEVAVPREIDCLLAAKDVSGVFGCDRFRREVGGLVDHKEPARADCERLFDRLRGFKIEEGAAPAEVDKDRDQIVRSCQEKAKLGTIVCFIASPTYEQARRCP
jgi:hypothetical protein